MPQNSPSHNIEELSADLDELSRLKYKSERPRIVNILSGEIEKISEELKVARNSLALLPVRLPKRYPIELTNFTFEQSAKFAKVFVFLNGVGDSCDANSVSVAFTDRAITLRVNGLNDNDYVLNIQHLLHDIVPASSFYRIKKNLVVIYALKGDETIEWDELTSITKRIKTMQENLDQFPAKEAAELSASKDPMAGQMMFMRAIQRIYQTGDASMRRKIEQGCSLPSTQQQ